MLLLLFINGGTGLEIPPVIVVPIVTHITVKKIFLDRVTAQLYIQKYNIQNWSLYKNEKYDNNGVGYTLEYDGTNGVYPDSLEGLEPNKIPTIGKRKTKHYRL